MSCISCPLVLKIKLFDLQERTSFCIYSKDGPQIISLKNKLKTFNFEILLKTCSIVILMINFEFEEGNSMTFTESLNCNTQNETIWKSSAKFELENLNILKKIRIQSFEDENNEILTLFLDEEFLIEYCQESKLHFNSYSYQQELSDDFCIINDEITNRFSNAFEKPMNEISRIFSSNKQTCLFDSIIYVLGDIYDDDGHKIYCNDFNDYQLKEAEEKEIIALNITRTCNFRIIFKIKFPDFASTEEIINIFKNELYITDVENLSDTIRIKCQKNQIIIIEPKRQKLEIFYEDPLNSSYFMKDVFSILVFIRKLENYNIISDFQEYKCETQIENFSRSGRFTIIYKQIIFDQSVPQMKPISDVFLWCVLLRDWVPITQVTVRNNSLLLFLYSEKYSIYIELKSLLSLHYEQNKKNEQIIVFVSKENLEYHFKAKNENFTNLITKTFNIHSSPIENLFKKNNSINFRKLDSIVKDGSSCFFKDCLLKFKFSYRKNFSKIEMSNYTSDTGWGCMIRAGQSLLAETLTKCINYEQIQVLSFHSTLVNQIFPGCSIA